MGYDATCTLTTGGRTFAGKASLEEKALIFRGEARLTIPLSIVAGAEASDGRLRFSAGGRPMVLELGVQAEKWARRIATPPSRLQKLGVKDGMRVGLEGVDDPVLAEDIEGCGAAIELGAGESGLDMIFFGAEKLADLDRLSALARRIQPAGVIWLLRLKGKAAVVSEAASMAAAKRAGLVDVKVVSYSETHSAEKYVIPVAKRPAAAARPKRPRSAAPAKRPGAAR